MITCYLRYQVPLGKVAEFEAYAAMWLDLMPRFGGIHHGYFLPSEGESDVALAMFSFPTLAAYEQYRKDSENDPDVLKAIAFVKETRCFTRFERSFFRPLFSEAGVERIDPARAEGVGEVSLATPRVFAIFLIVGTSAACVMLWATERLLLLIQNPPLTYDDVLSPGLLGAIALALVWVLPGQLFVAGLAGFFFSLFKRVPLWFVLSVLIPVCGLIATYRDITDRFDTIQASDYRKLLYWLMVVTPGELLCAGIVAMKLVPKAAQGLPGGDAA